LRCGRHSNIDLLFVLFDDWFFDAKPLKPSFDLIQPFKMLENRDTCRAWVYLLELSRERDGAFGF
jgi:hypothetical protein